MRHHHVIPVDPSQTARDAWLEQCIFGRRVTFTGPEQWATVACNGSECESIEQAEAGG